MEKDVKVVFPDVRGMTSEQKNAELVALRKHWLAHNTRGKTPKWVVSFWNFIDRVFRWRIMLIKVRNPLYTGKQSGDLTPAQREKEYMFFQELTSNPFFSFEQLLDHIIVRINRHILSVAKVPAEGFVFQTEHGKYEITIKEYSDSCCKGKII